MENELKEYWKKQEIEAKKFKLNAEDLANLYDLFYMITWQDYLILELNKMEGWFQKFFFRMEKIVTPELARN